jgi:hypothetical protein
MRNITTVLVLAFAFAAITIATIAPNQRHSMAIERTDTGNMEDSRTTNKWDSPAMPSPCELDPTLQGCGELIDVCELDNTLMGCGDPDYK